MAFNDPGLRIVLTVTGTHDSYVLSEDCSPTFAWICRDAESIPS